MYWLKIVTVSLLSALAYMLTGFAVIKQVEYWIDFPEYTALKGLLWIGWPMTLFIAIMTGLGELIMIFIDHNDFWLSPVLDVFLFPFEQLGRLLKHSDEMK